jgi:hypothetical protein
VDLRGQPTTNYGSAGGFNVVHETNTSSGGSGLVRFAIFQSEGGPVPAGATIISATLSLYKYNGGQAVIKASRLLKSWNPSSATWNLAAGGASWTTAGANGAGADYLASADGQDSVGDADADGCNVWPNFPAACWANIDVTSSSSGTTTCRYGTASRPRRPATRGTTSPMRHTDC